MPSPLRATSTRRAGGELTLLLPQTIIDILEHSSKERLQQLNCELQEWEEKEESKLSCKNPWSRLPDPLPPQQEVSYGAFTLC